MNFYILSNTFPNKQIIKLSLFHKCAISFCWLSSAYLIVTSKAPQIQKFITIILLQFCCYCLCRQLTVQITRGRLFCTSSTFRRSSPLQHFLLNFQFLTATLFSIVCSVAFVIPRFRIGNSSCKFSILCLWFQTFFHISCNIVFCWITSSEVVLVMVRKFWSHFCSLLLACHVIRVHETTSTYQHWIKQ